jgi:hypothetical protein
MDNMRKHNGMRPQDIIVLLAIGLNSKEKLLNIDISKMIQLSPAEVGESINRSKKAGLLNNEGLLLKQSFIDFVMYGLKYVFPVSPMGLERGIPTAYSATPLKDKISSNKNMKLVWPFTEGKDHGQAIEPLYHTVPKAALNNKGLYELLVLIDAVRIGGAREKNIAMKELEKRLV